MNSLYKQLGGIPAVNPQMQNMIQRFQQFKQTITGDPRQQVQQLLNSGRMTQGQYNQLVATANQLAPMLGIKH